MLLRTIGGSANNAAKAMLRYGRVRQVLGFLWFKIFLLSSWEKLFCLGFIIIQMRWVHLTLLLFVSWLVLLLHGRINFFSSLLCRKPFTFTHPEDKPLLCIEWVKNWIFGANFCFKFYTFPSKFSIFGLLVHFYQFFYFSKIFPYKTKILDIFCLSDKLIWRSKSIWL